MCSKSTYGIPLKQFKSTLCLLFSRLLVLCRQVLSTIEVLFKGDCLYCGVAAISHSGYDSINITT
jgi:hypothetical protein